MLAAPKYLVLTRTWLKPIGEAFDRLVEPGSEIGFDGEPGGALLPLNDAGRARVIEYDRRHRDTQSSRDRSRAHGLAGLSKDAPTRFAPAVAALAEAVTAAEVAAKRKTGART